MVKKAEIIVLHACLAITVILLGFASQELLMKPAPVPKRTVVGTPSAWVTDKNLSLNGYAHVLDIKYTVWDVTKQVNGSRQKVSIELLGDGSYMVYWPVEGGAKTAYVHLNAGFSGLGALVNEVLYGDPDAMIKPKALEK